MTLSVLVALSAVADLSGACSERKMPDPLPFARSLRDLALQRVRIEACKIATFRHELFEGRQMRTESIYGRPNTAGTSTAQYNYATISENRRPRNP
jgi:hypothetical protein